MLNMYMWLRKYHVDIGRQTHSTKKKKPHKSQTVMVFMSEVGFVFCDPETDKNRSYYYSHSTYLDINEPDSRSAKLVEQ